MIARTVWANERDLPSIQHQVQAEKQRMQELFHRLRQRGCLFLRGLLV